MNCSICYMELILYLDTEDFEKYLDRALQKSKEMYDASFGYVDESLVPKGIGIIFHNDSKRKKIKFIVYSPGLVIDGDDFTELWEPTPGHISKLTGKLDKLIVKYFQSGYGLGDFDLTRADFAVDIDVGSRERVSDYLKVLHNIGRVKCFSPMKYGERDGESKGDCFGLDGNSNGVAVRIHTLKHDKGVLRAEVRLIKKSTIEAYSDETDSGEQIRASAEGSEHIFMDSFGYVVPKGDFYKKAKVEKIIRERVSDWKLRSRMIRLLSLIKEQKSLLGGIKNLNFRTFNDVLSAFTDINLSPVTISKRHDVKKLESLYSYLED